MGFLDVLQAENGTDAWYMLKNYDIDAVISAWTLPDMSGLVLLRIVRADSALAGRPFVLVGEGLNKSQVIEAGEAGVNEILTRPLVRERFSGRIRMLFGVQEDPKDKEFQSVYNRGMEFMKQARFDEALDSFRRLLSIYESAEVYYNMGYIRTAQGRYEEALLAFRRATQINRAYAMAYQRMAEIFSKLGRRDEAQECLSQAAEIYLEKQMDDEAEATLLEALSLNPNTINVYNTLGIVYRRKKKYQEAIRYYRKALRVTPKDENIHFNLARVYLSVDNAREAMRSLRMSLDINPQFKEAARLLTELETRAGGPVSSHLAEED
jgi:tetratricopeptide (TPR) repeat protein